MYDFGAPSSATKSENSTLKIRIKSFQLSSTPVTNAQFFEFVKSTNYITDAEKSMGSSYYEENRGWQIDSKRTWKKPQGPDSNFKKLLDHPVVCITYNDAKAFCKWANVRLPSEIEWEYACKLGKTNSVSVNIHQDDTQKTNYQDTFITTSPVKYFGSNKLGLYSMLGNVWELCEDNYRYNIYQWKLVQEEYTQLPYLGKTMTDSDNDENTISKVIKGGSFLCSEKYCFGYQSNARQFANQNEAFFHIGFRVANK